MFRALVDGLINNNEKVPGGGVLPIMAYMGRLHPKGVPFPGFRYKKGFHNLRYMKG